MYPIVAEFELDYAAYRTFFLVSFCKNRLYRYIRYTYFLPFAALLALCALMLYYQQSVRFYTALILALSILFLFYTYILFFAPRLSFRRHTAFAGDTQRYYFYEGYLNVAVDEEGYKKIAYKDLFRVMETEDTFYLFTADTQGHVIPKKSMTEEQVLLIRKSIVEWLGQKKYKRLY